jgi:hypothetical protein
MICLATHDTDKNGRSLTADDPQDGIVKKQQNIGEQEHDQQDNAGLGLRSRLKGLLPKCSFCHVERSRDISCCWKFLK